MHIILDMILSSAALGHTLCLLAAYLKDSFSKCLVWNVPATEQNAPSIIKQCVLMLLNEVWLLVYLWAVVVSMQGHQTLFPISHSFADSLDLRDSIINHHHSALVLISTYASSNFVNTPIICLIASQHTRVVEPPGTLSACHWCFWRRLRWWWHCSQHTTRSFVYCTTIPCTVMCPSNHSSTCQCLCPGLDSCCDYISSNFGNVLCQLHHQVYNHSENDW